MNGDRRRHSWPARVLPWALLAAAFGVWAWSAALGRFDYGRQVGENLGEFALEMASFLPAMFLLVGLFDVWVPRSTIERHLGRGAGAAGVFWVVLLATLQAGPLYAAFPVAVALRRKGCTPANVFIYLGAFSAMKIPMLTFEVGFLGWQFSLARAALTLPVFIALGYLLERLLPARYELPGLGVARLRNLRGGLCDGRDGGGTGAPSGPGFRRGARRLPAVPVARRGRQRHRPCAAH